MNPFLEKIGKLLREERKSQGMNQTEAGKKIAVSRREISEMENGTFRGSVIRVQDYAGLLGFALALERKRRPLLNELKDMFDED